MKVKAAKDGVMVRLVVNGMPLFVTSNPVDIDEANPEVMEQVDAMMKLGWLVEVKEEKVQTERAHVKASGSHRKGGEGGQERE